MQDHPGAPGTARQESTRIIVSTYDGGNATQQRAPGHDRPRTASSGAARHGRLSAATGAPGADVPLANTVRAPGQYCLSAAPRAPGHDVSLASPVRAPGHDRLSAAPIATVSLPAGLHRLRQVILPRTPATPNTLTYLHSHRDTAHNRAVISHASPSPCTAGGPQGGQPQSTPSPGACSGGRPEKGPLTTNQVHPAIQVPPRPRSCSTAGTGFLRQHPSRAPPHVHPPTTHPLPWSLLRGRAREGATNH